MTKNGKLANKLKLVLFNGKPLINWYYSWLINIDIIIEKLTKNFIICNNFS